MKKTFRALAFATATAVGATGISVVLPQIALVAQAQTNDAMPHKYYYEPAADADMYNNEVNTFLTVTRLRHVYHMAAADWKYDNYPGTQAINQAHWRSEQQCWMGKARLALALMKAEGNAEARTLDLTKVGVDKAETEKAQAILKPEAQKWASAVFTYNENTPNRAEKESRKKIFNEGSDALQYWLDDINASQPVFEFNAFQVIDWSVPQSYIDKQLNNADHGDLGEVVLNQKVLKAAYEDNYDNIKADAEAEGEANRVYLEEKLGPIVPKEDPAPSSSETTEPTAAETTSSSAAPKPVVTSSEAPKTTEPTGSNTTDLSASIKKLRDQLNSSQGGKTLATILAVVAVIGGVAAAAFSFWPQIKQIFKF
ncbi:MAG: hypothetical protein Q4A82_06295 [Corynebacterium sp.]|nr:hypothetical protein [Corynebacterium sp.]